MKARICVALTAIFLSSPAAAAPDADKLMREADKRHRLSTERIKINMSLQKKGESPRLRTLEMSIEQDPKDKVGDKLRIQFDSPGNIKGTTFLTLEKKEGDDDQWLYLPAFKKTRRVGASELGDRFVGTDFYFEDLKRRLPGDYEHKLLKTEQCGKKKCYVIEARPRAESVVEQSPYGRSHIWLRKDNLFPLRIRHFGRDGKPLKELNSDRLRKVSKTAWRADRVVVVDIRRNHRTTIEVKGRQVGKELPSSLFDANNLGGS